MEEKICQVHQDEIVSVCFFEGCADYFLCSKCIKRHPDSHESNIKNIISLMKKDDWIKSNEEQRDSQIAHMKRYYQVKDCLIDENQEKLEKIIEEIIECVRKRLHQWTEELESLLDYHKNSKTKGTFSKLEDTLSRLTNINFREGDIFDKVDKHKLFNESTLPEIREACKQIQDVVDGVKIDQRKLDCCKKEMIELLDSIHLRDLFALSRSKQQKDSEQLNLLRQEYENFTPEKIELNQEIEHLKKAMNGLQAQLNSAIEQPNQLLELNNDYQQKIENLTRINEELRNEASMFEAELDSVVASKLKLHEDFKNLIIAHQKLRDRYFKSRLLSEDSLIIQDEDMNTIRAWLQKPANVDESFHHCRLHLLYRATQDGFNSEAFYKKCSGKPPTITFIKSKEYGRVFGGYTTENWDIKNKKIQDNESFLFSLTHSEKYPKRRMNFPVSVGPNLMLCFGSDISILEGCNTQYQAWSNFPLSYKCSKFPHTDYPGAKEHLAGSEYFTVEEIEVYQVVWSK